MLKGARIGLLILMVAILLSIDQITKLWAYSALALGQSLSIPGPINLTLILNRSNAFGLTPDYGTVTRWGLAAFNVIVACFIIYRVWSRKHEPFMVTGLAFITSGAVGNAIDRIWLGSVIDMFDASKSGFIWVFNPADVFIDVGIALLVLCAVFGLGADARIGPSENYHHLAPIAGNTNVRSAPTR